MKRLLVLGVLSAAVLVPSAMGAPSAAATIRGTVVAKDRAHHALVVARPNGRVQTLVAPAAFGRARIGRNVLVRYRAVSGKLPIALRVSFKGHARKAVVRGTVVRLIKRKATLNAGGSLLDVTLGPAKARRSLAATHGGPGVGDTVKVEVEIDDDGSLDHATVISTTAAHGAGSGSAGEMEVRGTVSALTSATADSAGSITVVVRGLPVSCVIPAGLSLDVVVGDMIELECRLVGDPAAWTVRGAESEDESGDDEHSGSGKAGASGSGGDSTEVEVRGTITAGFLQTSDVVVVTPDGGGPDVSCLIVPGSLSRFAAGDAVELECIIVDGTLTLKEIEKVDGEHGDDDEGGGDHGHDNDDDHGDDHHGGDED